MLQTADARRVVARRWSEWWPRGAPDITARATLGMWYAHLAGDRTDAKSTSRQRPRIADLSEAFRPSEVSDHDDVGLRDDAMPNDTPINFTRGRREHPQTGAVALRHPIQRAFRTVTPTKPTASASISS